VDNFGAAPYGRVHGRYREALSQKRHAEPGHPVEDIATNVRLGPLIGQSPGAEAPTDHSPMLAYRCNMLVALCGRCFICTAAARRRDNDRGSWMTVGNGVVDGLAIIRAVSRHRPDVGID
jgi:hypothetical protein